MPRPAHFAYDDEAIRTVYDWLLANGVDEMLPEHASIVITGDTMAISGFDWKPGWVDKWDPDGLIVLPDPKDPNENLKRATRFVKLRVPPTRAVRDAFHASGGKLTG